MATPVVVAADGYPTQPRTGEPCNVEVRKPRAGPGAELAGVDDHDLVPGRLQLTNQLHQRGDHAIDLGRPGVGDEHEFHGVSVRLLVVGRWHQTV